MGFQKFHIFRHISGITKFLFVLTKFLGKMRHLVGEYVGLIIMKIIKHIGILHKIQSVQVSNTVHIITSHQHPSCGINLMNFLHRSLIQPVPLVSGCIRNLIEQLKHQSDTAKLPEMHRHLFPETYKVIAQIFFDHQRRGFFHLPKHVPGDIVQINNHVHPMLAAPGDTSVKIIHGLLFQSLLFTIIKQVTVNRDPDMVKSPVCDLSDIFPGYKGIKMLAQSLLVFRTRNELILGQISAQINSLPKLFK